MTECITTPASCARRPTVAVLGAGIAGLTAAHELAERGFDVTVYEPRRDERNGIGVEPPGYYPPVKLGGLAASQYSTVGTQDGSPAELRPFPGRRGTPPTPGRAIAGEHGFRFFPAYYLHTWDLFQRIPTYEPVASARGDVTWQATSRTVMDNVKRVITQGTTLKGHENLVFPREAPRSQVESRDVNKQLRQLGFTSDDITKFLSRILRYLATSPLRRATELQNISAYDFFVGRDKPGDPRRITYSPRFEKYLLEMPRVLAAFDSRWGDARTNITTFLQLQLQLDRRDNKADGVLNGPTTEAWFDHWYRHLVNLGVRFVHGSVDHIEPLAARPDLPPHLRPRVRITLADGSTVTPDYTVVAVDAPAAERISAPMRASGTGGAAAKLDGFTTFAPPSDGPLTPGHARSAARRNPYAMDEMGRKPWDRFQTLAGIQYFFDTEFQLIRGHMYYSGSEWGLSSINQHGMWEKRPTLLRDGHISVLSVDIGDFNAVSSHLGKAARDCTADEIAAEVWRQIAAAVTDTVDNTPEALLPWPSWYALDQGLIMAGGPGQGGGRATHNLTPYLVPIVGDWDNRPGRDPWNPHNTSLQDIPPEDVWLDDLELRNVWQARHGGYFVHNNSVVFAGTWARTFTRMTSMEAAGESARHAVNAILDHYVWVTSNGADRREHTSLNWRFPFGFIDQGFSSPVRMPSPAGDYCYVFDIENREPAETRELRILDGDRCERSQPHPLDSPFPPRVSTPECSPPGPNGGHPMMPSPFDDNQQLTTYVNALRQLLEPLTSATTGQPTPPNPFAQGQNSLLPPAPADYSQQLFSYLQAWRQYLENSVGTPPAPASPQPPHGNRAAPAQSPSAMAPTRVDRRQNAVDPRGGGQIGDPNANYEDLVKSPEPHTHRDTASTPSTALTPPAPPTPPKHERGQNERGSTRLPTGEGPSLYSTSAASGATPPQEIIKMSRSSLLGGERAAELQPSAPGRLQNAEIGDGSMGTDREIGVVTVGPVMDLSKYNLSPALHEDRSFITSNDLASLFQAPPATAVTSSTTRHFGTAHARISEAVAQHEESNVQPD